ncbi:hypothetical protein COY93_03365 [Candidatus Uhrbacteria bacterium CG_4_10_14_0_8_um_filter_58_22]|uniref:Metallo-beta-lactamase domain-containing protein n=1 Tax=Candidatus Uhrbacteria bacterium CG_4_10_14_0_8_um_filter_58_22 TaxID=1975029 RepID=A0A2M7QAQ7_9BACT|nr:MAG: hypothetical protein AUJ19_03080 [Parcubacteria group bacterium CG1_02_58_44]PIY62427.1 MAG: hypothetical protein COY93_03365 [Candidatus Uhrbacteria bacterium CG_4_10_14_0_8_um_filter_58_22]
MPRKVKSGGIRSAFVRVGRLFRLACRLLPALVLLPILISLPLVWSWPANHGAHFTLHVFDVGQGDSSLVQCGRVQALVDGGPDRQALSGLGRSMPFTDRRIEYVFLSHPHDDHVFGLFAALERYEVGRLVVSPYAVDLPLGQELLALAVERGVPMTVAEAGDSFTLGDCGELTVLWPDGRVEEEIRGSRDRTNDLSLVLELRDRAGQDQTGVLALLMGDAGFLVEDQLVARGVIGPTSVLKVGHHGSRYSTGTEFIRAAAPKSVVISVGENDYGHPSQITLQRLGSFADRIFRTDRDGTVVFDLENDRKISRSTVDWLDDFWMRLRL